MPVDVVAGAQINRSVWDRACSQQETSSASLLVVVGVTVLLWRGAIGALISYCMIIESMSPGGILSRGSSGCCDIFIG